MNEEREREPAGIPACPKCGGTDGYDITYKLTGTSTYEGKWESVISKDDETGINSDNHRFGGEPRYVTCINCGEKIPNPASTAKRRNRR